MDSSQTCGTCEGPLMMPGGTTSIFESVQLSPMKNNFLHHTSEISMMELIVRRGRPFDVTVKLTKPFDPKLHPFKIFASTGELPSEDLGTASTFGIPDTVNRSASAKAVWKVELHKDSDSKSGKLVLSITPPADAPIGEYTIMGWHRDEEKLLAKPAVLFNPWCPDDQVYMENLKELQEYVMNEQGVLYRGSKNYIMPLDWDLGQFEDDMVKISLKMLDSSHKHKENPAQDVASRSDPIYVGRVISAMINSEDDDGVLQGNWGGSYEGGFSPSHWSGSHTILKRWYNNIIHQLPVKYGQCWVFAGVMCSVMRLLGVPTRTITNFSSAHDTNGNLTIDRFHAVEGVTPKETHDSVWNFHVWTESYMKRPDLSETGNYDGWQVLDPTPQELSNGVYCCGPAPVKAIQIGQTDLKYDIPFVFAEVNADIVEWLVEKDGSQTKIESFPGRVGINISTKAVGSKKRVDVTDSYKPKEGTEKERAVFKYATEVTQDYSATDDDEEMEEEDNEEGVEENDGAEEGEDSVETEEVAEGEVAEEPDDDETEEDTDDEEVPVPVPPVLMKFIEVTHPTNGKDVRLKLKLKSSTARQVSINISIQAMHYNGRPAVNIKHQEVKKSLKPGKALLIPIRVPFVIYHEHMINADSMNVSAVVTDLDNPGHMYLADDEVVLLDPPISLEIFGKPRVNRRARGEVVFKNPAKEKLTECYLTLSGSGLWRDEVQVKIPDMFPNTRIRAKFYFVPYKAGKKVAMADFDCKTFKDIKVSFPVKVMK